MLCATGSTDGRHTRQRENGPAQSIGAPLPTACITEMLTGKVMGEGCGVGYVGGIGAPLVHTTVACVVTKRAWHLKYGASSKFHPCQASSRLFCRSSHCAFYDDRMMGRASGKNPRALDNDHHSTIIINQIEN